MSSYPIQLSQGWSKLAEEVDAEIARARRLFPGPDLKVTSMVEEMGEAVREILNGYHDGGRTDRTHLLNVRKELVQTMAMCVRLVLEGDPAHRLPGQGE